MEDRTIKKFIIISSFIVVICFKSIVPVSAQIQVIQNIQSTEKEDIIQYAKQFIGNPYIYGGNSLTNGIDCSHFVWQVLCNTGHYNGEYRTSGEWASAGQQVESLDDAIAGDIIVYSGHVAIYDGQGKIIQAKGKAYGITYDRSADYKSIKAIRRFN